MTTHTWTHALDDPDFDYGATVGFPDGGTWFYIVGDE